MNIQIKDRQRKRRLKKSALATRLEILLRSIGLPDAELSIVFVGNEAMRTLNKQYRNKDTTTDVLSFSLREGAFQKIQPHMLGDIVVSVPVAVRQAVMIGHSLDAEIDRLVVHGLVHLLGYDHERGSREAALMETKELQFLKRMAP
jgi:probable rRNA maturation factor